MSMSRADFSSSARMPSPSSVHRIVIDSPIGRLAVDSAHGAIIGLHFVDSVTPAEESCESGASVSERRRPRIAASPASRKRVGDVVSCGLESDADASFASLELLEAARGQLQEYFAGRRTAFDLPLSLDGCGEFQRRVLAEVAAIPFGATDSYGGIAARIGRPQASRAVGQANGRNPISLLIPCHRVIGANGALTGYGGGLPAKIWLLRHEGVLLSQ